MERKGLSEEHSQPGDRRGTGQDVERKEHSVGHSLPRDHRVRNESKHRKGPITHSLETVEGGRSGHGKKVTQQGALTS